MGIKDGTTEYKLKQQLEYRYNGNAELATHVVLKEPGMDHIKFYYRLKQMIIQSQVEVQSKQSDIIQEAREANQVVGEVVKPFHESVEDMEQKAINMVPAVELGLQVATCIDLGEFIDTFRKMATMKARKSICVVDGKQQMTESLWQMLHPDDGFKMACWWCSFFAMPSPGQDSNTLDRQSA